MPRPQFTLRDLLLAMLVVAAFLSGVAVERHRNSPVRHYKARGRHGGYVERMRLRDGSDWQREVQPLIPDPK
jgi:hypothetical protein